MRRCLNFRDEQTHLGILHTHCPAHVEFGPTGKLLELLELKLGFAVADHALRNREPFSEIEVQLGVELWRNVFAGQLDLLAGRSVRLCALRGGFASLRMRSATLDFFFGIRRGQQAAERCRNIPFAQQ